MGLAFLTLGLNSKELLKAFLRSLLEHHSFGTGPVKRKVALSTNDDVMVTTVRKHAFVLASLRLYLSSKSVWVHI
jgi:hypothetical protein